MHALTHTESRLLHSNYENPKYTKRKCRKAEYVQRRVCFVNVQDPFPHSNIYIKLCTSRLCMKMSSFLFLCTWAMPRILYLSCGIPFPPALICLPCLFYPPAPFCPLLHFVHLFRSTCPIMSTIPLMVEEPPAF